MTLKSASSIVGLVCAFVCGTAFALDGIDDAAFNAQGQVINQDVQGLQVIGDFGRVGRSSISGTPGEMGPQADVATTLGGIILIAIGIEQVF